MAIRRDRGGRCSAKARPRNPRRRLLLPRDPMPCSHQGCTGSPFGDNWVTWRADFFTAADPLLKAAPWVFVRGNHETCRRGGEGWNRMLGPYAFDAAAVCKTYEEPYVVKFAGLTLAIMDVSEAKEEVLDEAQVQIYRRQQ